MSDTCFNLEEEGACAWELVVKGDGSVLAHYLWPPLLALVKLIECLYMLL